jgi:transcriptional regulator GlxA family with amidase domain
MREIGFLLFPGLEELDFAGPWEVFSALSALESDSCRCFTVSETGGLIRCAKGLRVESDFSFANAPACDVLVIPGGQGTRREVDNANLTGYIGTVARSAEITYSVCTGAFLLERAGLLTGKRATTHWHSIDRLAKLGSATVVADERFVDQGRIVTAAGVSAGIDGALHVVGRLWSPNIARKVQQQIEYFPAPPYQDVAIPPMP